LADIPLHFVRSMTIVEGDLAHFGVNTWGIDEDFIVW